MGKTPAGLRTGAMTSFGEYDQCLDIKSPMNGERDPIYGKYCLVRIYMTEQNVTELVATQPEMDINQLKLLMIYNLFADKFYIFNWGICIPSQCSAQDLLNFLNKG